MTPDELNKIKARCEAATEGPWDDDGMYSARGAASNNYALDPRLNVSVVMAQHGGDVALINNLFPEKQQRANSSFIAHARKDLPDCIAEIERLRGAIQLASTYFENDEYYKLGKVLEAK